jgi:hypothetical protein
MEKAEVIADYDAKSADELTVRVGETVEITDKEKDSSGWWKVNNMVPMEIIGSEHVLV